MTELSRQDIQQILDLIEKSAFDFFELRSGEFRLTVSKTGVPSGIPIAADTPAAERPAPAAPPAAAPPREVAQPPEPPGRPPVAEPTWAEGLVPVKAPVVGTFYAQSEPGAPPYVQVGSRVDEDTTLGLVELMKVFNAVRSGVRGTVEQILVGNAEFIEFGQPLFLIRPEPAGT